MKIIIIILILLSSTITYAKSKVDNKNDKIPLEFKCKISDQLGEKFNSCDYNIENELKFSLMISQASGRHTLTLFKQNDYDNPKTKYYMKSGNLLHSCLIIMGTTSLIPNVLFISTKDGSIVSDWGDPKCSL